MSLSVYLSVVVPRNEYIYNMADPVIRKPAHIGLREEAQRSTLRYAEGGGGEGGEGGYVCSGGDDDGLLAGACMES